MPVERGDAVEIELDGERLACFGGETVAAALLAAGVYRFGTTRDGEPRQPFCNMGTCFDCAVTIDGRALTRSCLTTVRDGMRVETTRGH
ncbi:sarcosine oxidase subunit alpha [Leifsonia xyli subsp. xyli]|uniref:Sarcosine oxidase subunit alpha n=1 Tax=Leifsonia xyli subsp. xyli TaxID=59736 RepID=A0A1E2SLD2_LEIXY|nr:sarcosine oxidase subunit alpha [Leifsonia xyli subsp. xyli]